MFFKQIKYRGDNFSYVIADEGTNEAAVVDPSFNADVIIQLLKRQNFHALYIINTHNHLDHTAGNDEVRLASNAKVVASRLSTIKKDLGVLDGDVLKVGQVTIKIIFTPGHTPDGVCLLVDGKVLTGDTLFVGECGRIDLPGGSAKDLYDSLFDKLMKLDESVEVYPGHDYGTRPHSTIGEEKRTNYVLEERSLQEFMEFMGQP